jgi:hypothetical protein
MSSLIIGCTKIMKDSMECHSKFVFRKIGKMDLKRRYIMINTPEEY